MQKVYKFDRVNCHFGPCGLGTFAILVQISNFLHLGPCGLHFVAILVQNPKTLYFYCWKLIILSFSAGAFWSMLIYYNISIINNIIFKNIIKTQKIQKIKNIIFKKIKNPEQNQKPSQKQNRFVKRNEAQICIFKNIIKHHHQNPENQEHHQT